MNSNYLTTLFISNTFKYTAHKQHLCLNSHFTSLTFSPGTDHPPLLPYGNRRALPAPSEGEPNRYLPHRRENQSACSGVPVLRGQAQISSLPVRRPHHLRRPPYPSAPLHSVSHTPDRALRQMPPIVPSTYLRDPRFRSRYFPYSSIQPNVSPVHRSPQVL